MSASFYFYDLETSGFSPRSARVMQFGGQRTDMDLKPIGKPHNFYIKLSEDVLPEPDAVLVTGITPQKTQKEGLTEAEFLKVFYEEVVQPDTIFVGFNNIRFDDEFMRFLHYRNFYDAYEWQWKNGRSRWDLLDATRMTRALRPEGIKWPFNSEGIASNQLTLLTGVNKLDHADAHDAVSDVLATIEFARLLKAKQARLFNYLLELRSKSKVAEVVKNKQPYLYTSGKYSSEFDKTTVVQTIAENSNTQGVLVYDLRQNPAQFADMTPEELAAIWKRPYEEDEVVLPIKTLKFNHCPAVAPLGVLDNKSAMRLKIDLKEIEANRKALRDIKSWPENILKALDILTEQQQTRLFEKPVTVDEQLYSGFLDDPDRGLAEQIHSAEPEKLTSFEDKLKDERLKELLPLYKARNFASSLNSEEQKAWKAHCQKVILDGKENKLKNYFARIDELKKQPGANKQQKHLLQELQDYGQAVKKKLA